MDKKSKICLIVTQITCLSVALCFLFLSMFIFMGVWRDPIMRDDGVLMMVITALAGISLWYLNKISLDDPRMHSGVSE